MIDGFNVFHSIKDLIKEGLDEGAAIRWLDLRSLADSFLHQMELSGFKEVSEVHYFTALAHHKQEADPGHVQRHQNYLRVLREVGVETHEHRFKKLIRSCDNCGGKVKSHEEKESDVAIAVKLIQLFAQNRADVAIIVSGDTDMAPAVRCVFEMFPNSKIWFGFPYKRKNEELARLVAGRGGTFKISPERYRSCLLPDPFITRRKKEIRKPREW